MKPSYMSLRPRPARPLWSSILVAGLGAWLLLAPRLAARELRLGEAFGTMDAPVEVPVLLEADGDENSLSFSVRFDPAKFTFESFVLSAAARGSSHFLNTSSNIHGLVGILLGQGFGEQFAKGQHEIGRVLLRPKTVAVRSPIAFSDTPVARQTVNADALPLATRYEAGRATAVEREVRLLETAAVNGAEFTQRIQSVGSGLENAWSFTIEFDPALLNFRELQAAPGLDGAVLVRNTTAAAQGRIGVLLALPGGRTLEPGTNDLAWVHFQSARPDLSTTVRFVEAPVTTQAVDINARPLPVRFAPGSVEVRGRRLRVPVLEAELGDVATVPVELIAAGDEHALALTVSFNAQQLAYLSVSPGTGMDPGSLQVNTSSLAAGRLGFIVAAPPGAVLPPGRIALAQIRFFARGAAGFTSLGLASAPIRIEVLGRSGESLAFAQVDGGLNLRTPEQPRILDQPRDTEVLPGASTALFSVVADGSKPLFYQWRRDGLELNGATNAQLALQFDGESRTATLAVEVSNAAGTVVSQSAKLEFLAPPVITRQPPAAQSVRAGAPFALSVAADGTAPLSYEWQRNGVVIPGAAGPSLFVPSAGDADDGDYRVVVANRTGLTAASAVARVRVVRPPSIAAPPAPATRTLGQSVTFSVNATGTPPLTYQWQRNGQNIPDATNPTYSIPSVAFLHGGLYTVVVANEVEAITSQPAELQVAANPSPAQDNFSQAGALAGLSGTVGGSNESATREVGEPNHAGKSGRNSVWLKWRSARSGRMKLDTLGSSFDTLLAVYSGTTLARLAESLVADDDDGGPFFASSLEFNVQANTDYFIALDGFRGVYGEPSGRYIFSWAFAETVELLPEISRQPAGFTLPRGRSDTLSVGVTGGPYTFQWLFNGNPIAGQTGATLAINNLDNNQVGNYSVRVTHARGLSVTSDVAVVEIGPDPRVQSVDKPVSFGPGRQSSLRAAATGAQALQVSIGPSVQQVYSHAQAVAQQFETNRCPRVGARTKYLNIVAQSDGTLVVQIEAAFPAYASIRDAGAREVSYAESCGGLSHRLEARVQAGQPFVIYSISDEEGPVQITFALGDPPAVADEPPRDLDVVDGAEIELDAPSVLLARPTPSFQWYLDGVPIPNAVGPRLRISQSGAYSVRVSNAVGQVIAPVAAVSALVPMRLGTPRLVRGGRALAFDLLGTVGQSYALSSTPDFLAWTAETKGRLAQGLLHEQPLTTSPQHQFYRLEERAAEVSKVNILDDGSFDVTIAGGRVGKAYVLERRDGGGPWVSVSSGVVRNADLHFTDTQRGGGAIPQYRVRSVSRP